MIAPRHPDSRAPQRSAPRDPAWRARLVWAAGALLLLWPLLLATEFKPWRLMDPDSLAVTGRFVGSFWPPAHDAEFLWMTAQATWRTVAMATAGVTLGLLLAIPLALCTTAVLSVSQLQGRMSPFSASVRAVLRLLMAALRSVPELVWALMFVRVVGLGPTAGVLAIALTYGGMLGKVYADILEASQGSTSPYLLRSGASRWQALCYGLLPETAAELTSYTIYRWECAIRSSVVLGMVGAGGIGQQMDSAMKMFNGAEVASLLLIFMALVALADRLSALARRHLG